ncbi:amidohydrolase family protein [Lichenihabitans psoromatis]|uniref:amidohydrolase family protein n=1 Tax=Lichenihabitans psoromatis TaxID=2528642 RepID=UPI0010356C71|nr:amidohydrolase family protein [Lichenihabitans psoromatis]
MIDSHQHFWRLSRGDYGWMGAHVAPLLRDFMPADLAPLMAATGITRTIVVQAAATMAETDFLLGLAQETDFVVGVVGWLDMDSDDFAEHLAHYAGQPKWVGLRPMLQDHPDDAFILRPLVLRNLARVAEAGVAFDILSFTRHLPSICEALTRTPGLKAVVDHVSKPQIAAGLLDPWRDQLAAVAAFPNVSCKLSGLVTEASPGAWTLDELRPYVDHAVACFGPDRLMFGSDWPVCTLAASYTEVVEAAHALLAPHFGPEDLDKVFKTNAERFYLGRSDVLGGD